MTLNEIKAAVDAGKTVYWMTHGYTVIHDQSRNCSQWLIGYGIGRHNENYIGLTHRDNVTMNGQPEEFFTD